MDNYRFIMESQNKVKFATKLLVSMSYDNQFEI